MESTNDRTGKSETVIERMTREVSEVGSGRREPARAVSTKSGSFYRVGMHDAPRGAAQAASAPAEGCR